jgi:hypothetical protein
MIIRYLYNLLGTTSNACDVKRKKITNKTTDVEEVIKGAFKDHLRISFSQILEKKGKRLIGLKEAESSGGLQGLLNIIIWENFHIMYVRKTMVFFLENV